MSEDFDIEAARKNYARPLYERLCGEVLHVLEAKLSEAKIYPASISHRSTSMDSFAEKIARKHYTDPLSEMTDCGRPPTLCLRVGIGRRR